METLSIIVPVYNNQESLPALLKETLTLEEKIPEIQLELIFVDDGSKDRSLEVLLDLQKQHPKKVIVVKLARNFGAVSAERAGFPIATGNCVGILSADLQDPPDLFVQMYPHWRQGSKMVFAVRTERQDTFLSMAFSAIYYRLLRGIAFPNYPKKGFDIFLIDREVVNELNRFTERNLQFQPLLVWLGYPATLVPYARRPRLTGKSGWSFQKRLKMALDVILGFSYVPIRLMSLIGIVCALFGFAYGLVIIVYWYLYSVEVRGYASLMVAILSVSGLQMIMIGVLGEYLWRILDETRRRPAYVIDQVFRPEA